MTQRDNEKVENYIYMTTKQEERRIDFKLTSRNL